MDESRASSASSFDVFLSHSIKDADVVLGIKALLEKGGWSVYVDWLVDGNLDRSNVTSATADHLRMRMKQSKSMVYAHSKNSPGSKWMPWELGFFDGGKKAIAIFPVAKTDNESFQGQEFLGLYPYIDTSHVGSTSLFVNKGNSPKVLLGTAAEVSKDYVSMKDWMQTRVGIRRTA